MAYDIHSNKKKGGWTGLVFARIRVILANDTLQGNKGWVNIRNCQRSGRTKIVSPNYVRSTHDELSYVKVHPDILSHDRISQMNPGYTG